MLNPRMVRLAKQWLPKTLLAKLDPFEDHIERFTAALASQVSAREMVLDAGAGEGRFRRLFDHAVYVGLDSAVGDRNWDYAGLDVAGDLCQMPFKAETFDYIFCMVVLEHTQEPGKVLQEFHRVLRARGGIRLVVPLLWEEHQKPHDYFRFTSHGMEYLLKKANFRIDRIDPIGGFFWVLARRCVNLLTFFQAGWRRILFFLLAPAFGFILPILCYYLDRVDRQKHFTLGYAVTAHKADNV